MISHNIFIKMIIVIHSIIIKKALREMTVSVLRLQSLARL